jgi:hypothetical protein
MSTHDHEKVDVVLLKQNNLDSKLQMEEQSLHSQD